MTTANEQRVESLSRAQAGLSTANYAAILDGFADRGIHDAEPRVNVFTYQAWQALGRQVQKGQRGIKIHTWIVCKVKKSERQDAGEGDTYKRRKTVAVFHISQTERKA